MSIYKRGDTWHYSFMCNGKRIRGSTGETVEKKAKEFENAKLKKLKGEHTVQQLAEKVQTICFGNSIPLNEAWDEFMKVPRKHDTGAKRIFTNRKKYLDFLAFMTDKYPDIEQMNLVTAIHAEEYIQHLRKTGRYKTSKKISVATVNDTLAVIKMIFNTLQERAEIYKNPFARIEAQNKDTAHREAFSLEELKLIGEKSKGTWLYPLFLAGISTGLREGDICTLRWSEVNLSTGWINDRILSKTKSKVSIPLLPSLHNYLSTLPQEGEYCFPELALKYNHAPGTIGMAVTKFLESLGIKSTVVMPGRSRASSIKDVHSLRHTFAYLAAVNHIPIPIVQSILGHFSAEMTKMYTDHATSGAKEEYMKMIPDYLSGDEVLAILPPPKNNTLELVESMTADNWQAVKAELISKLK